jgi:hypothetical protein
MPLTPGLSAEGHYAGSERVQEVYTSCSGPVFRVSRFERASPTGSGISLISVPGIKTTGRTIASCGVNEDFFDPA